MQILRMQDDLGRGPFDVACVMPLSFHPKVNYEHFPEPREEGLNFTRDHYCGCKNARQFIHWFPRPVRKALEYYGFHPTILDVPDELVEEGEYQVIFIRQEG